MGLFDFLSKGKGDRSKSGKSAKDVARLERLVSNKLTQNYDRQEAIAELSKMADRASSAALFKRFDWSLDPSITDQEEKESCLQGIVAAGEDALEPLRNYCKKAQSLTWPLKVLRAIVPEDRMADEMLSLLDQFDTEYTRNVEPKVQLLQALEGHPSEEVRVAVEPFLQDAGETVRFTAANTVFAMGDPASVPAFVALLETEESLRVKNRIAQGLADRGWAIPADLADTCGKSLPPGYALAGDKVTKTG
jgi:HEAT repeat protein